MFYSVCLLFKSDRTDTREPLWEERLILIEAVDESEAKEKAKVYAENSDAAFAVSGGATVSWRFSQVERVFLIDDDLNDGAELFTRFLRDSEARSLLTPFDDDVGD